MMKSVQPFLVIAASGFLFLAPSAARASDGTITITGTIIDSTCSINGNAGGTPADFNVVLPMVSVSALTAAGQVAGTSGPNEIKMTLTGCSDQTTKAIAHFENGPTVDQTTGRLLNSGGSAKNVEVELLNAQLQPINILTSTNNALDANGAKVVSGGATLQYYAQYYATGAATAGTVNTTVLYSMQYQ